MKPPFDSPLLMTEPRICGFCSRRYFHEVGRPCRCPWCKTMPPPPPGRQFTVNCPRCTKSITLAASQLHDKSGLGVDDNNDGLSDTAIVVLVVAAAGIALALGMAIGHWLF